MDGRPSFCVCAAFKTSPFTSCGFISKNLSGVRKALLNKNKLALAETPRFVSVYALHRGTCVWLCVLLVKFHVSL